MENQIIIDVKETKLSERLERLHWLEAEIEVDYLAFVRVGNDLLEIKNKELYKEENYNNFPEYLEKRWKWKQSYAYSQMNAAYIHGYLEENSAMAEFPTNERQIRPLEKLATFKSVETKRKNPHLWIDAWKKAVEIAQEAKSVVTEKHVLEAVNAIIKKNKLGELKAAPPWTGKWELDRIYIADVTSKEWLDTMPESNVDFVITDPPWRPDEEDGAYMLYEAIGRLSNKVLKPGGFCAVYLGKLDLPILFHIMTQYLDYEWTVCVYYPNGGWNFRKTQYKECWRPIGIFRKPGDRQQTIYIPDAMTSERDKTFHEWQQGIEPVKALIEKYTAPGQLVLDPFVGGGTGPAAAKSTGRKYLAFDIDETTAAIATKRLSEDNG